MGTKRNVGSQDIKAIRPPFQREEWDFSPNRVSDSELYPCLIYEYARESKILVNLSASRDKWMVDNTNSENRAIDHYNNQHADSIRQGTTKTVALKPTGQIASYEEVNPQTMDVDEWNEFYTGFHTRAANVPLYDWIYEFALDWARPYFEPWQLMEASLRKKISFRGRSTDADRMVSLALLKDLEKLWLEHSAGLEDLRKDPYSFSRVPNETKLAQWDMSEQEWLENEFRFWESGMLHEKINPILRDPDSPFAPDEMAYLGRGRTIAAFALDLERFSNSQLATAFRSWLDKVNPRGRNKPPQRGIKRLNTPRAALECLGVTRLLHRYPARSWREACPDAWKLYWPNVAEVRKGQDPARILYKKRERALAYFYKLFPFLENEKPISWPTAGGHSI